MQTEALAPLTCVETNPALLYLLTLSTHVSRRTQRSALHDFVRWAHPGADLASFPWVEVRANHLLVYRDYVGRRLAPRTANRYLSAVRAVIRMAWRQGLIEADVLARALDVPVVPGSSVTRGRALSNHELQQLLAAAGAQRSRWCRARDGALLAVLYASGLRREEVSRLRIEELGRDDEGHLILKVRGKGSKERFVPVAVRLLEKLETWLGQRGLASGPLFTAAPGVRRSMHPDTISHRVSSLARRAGIAACTPHDYRRTYASRLFDAGADLPAVKDLMGHSSVTTTAQYDRRGERAKNAAADKLPSVS